MASTASGEGPKGFSLESSLTSRDRRSSAAGVVLGAFILPRLRAGCETTSKKRLMLCRSSCHGRLRPRYRFVAGSAQAIDFLRRQRAKSSGGNIECERPVADALNLFHMVPNLLKHAPDFPVAAFDQSDFIPGIHSFLNQAYSGGRGPHPAAVFRGNRNTCAQLLQ